MKPRQKGWQLCCDNIAMTKMTYYKEIREKLNHIKVIDAQECINADINYDLENKDVFYTYILHYLIRELVSAGMVSDTILSSITDPKVPAETRFKLALPYMKACSNTGYFRALKRSFAELHGLNDLNPDSLAKLQNDYLLCKDKEYVYDTLYNKFNIEAVLLDIDEEFVEQHYDKRIFKRVWHPEKYIKPGPVSGEVIKWVERHYSEIKSLDDWVRAFDEELTDKLGRGVVALKITLGSVRSLYFEDVSYSVAKVKFYEMLQQWKEAGAGERDHVEFPREVQDFMMHRVLSSLRGRGVVIQFDTGMQHDNRNILNNAKPINLNNLFEHYEDVKFDILGIGWPYWREVVALAKMYPNVFINFSGSHIVSALSCIECLKECIDTLPVNKIIGFGGNYLFFDGVYAQLETAKDNIARALSQLIEYGLLDMEKAMMVAEAILNKNPKRIYKI